MRLIPSDVLAVLEIAETGFSTKSTQARSQADAVAEAASRGWLTTQTGPTTFSRAWRLTTAGLAVLNMERGIA